MDEVTSVLLEPREVPLGGTRAMTVRRTLPHIGVRTIGPWCFVDHYGPQDVSVDGRGGMRVPPHPHIGLQTVTWLVEGEVVHDDSLGSHQVIRPGELNLMTAGAGIAHAEVSPARAGSLHGVQLWVALPDESRTVAPHFEHHADLPQLALGRARATVLVGAFDGTTSPARTYSPILGAVLHLPAGQVARLPLVRGFEHALLPLDGSLDVAGRQVQRGELLGIGAGPTSLTVRAARTAQVLLLGGEPFEDDLVMWWNFVARSHEEVAAARADWAAGRRFGAVAYDGDPLPAPPLVTTRLVPRGSGGLRSAPAGTR